LSEGRAIADQYATSNISIRRKSWTRAQGGTEGYDAFLIGNIFEPASTRCEELVNIPVLGSASPRSTWPASWVRAFDCERQSEVHTPLVENIISYGLASSGSFPSTHAGREGGNVRQRNEKPGFGQRCVDQFMERAGGIAKGAKSSSRLEAAPWRS